MEKPKAVESLGLENLPSMKGWGGEKMLKKKKKKNPSSKQ